MDCCVNIYLYSARGKRLKKPGEEDEAPLAGNLRMQRRQKAKNGKNKKEELGWDGGKVDPNTEIESM